jgi:hypothetical protein
MCTIIIINICPCIKRPLGRLSIDGRILLNCILRRWTGGMDQIDLALDRDRWEAVECSSEPLGLIKCGELLQ